MFFGVIYLGEKHKINSVTTRFVDSEHSLHSFWGLSYGLWLPWSDPMIWEILNSSLSLLPKSPTNIFHNCLKCFTAASAPEASTLYAYFFVYHPLIFCQYRHIGSRRIFCARILIQALYRLADVSQTGARRHFKVIQQLPEGMVMRTSIRQSFQRPLLGHR